MQLKDKVIRELEERVQERTLALGLKNKELEECNQRLVVQANTINKINSLLDLDNWKLKNKIKEVLEEQIHETAMSFEKFKTIYADALSCYRFLENLKWGTGFSCRHCTNEKYFDGAHKFDRRCTRCGYNESITSYTVFHGIKFPIEKAFYIAFVAVVTRKKITLQELSSMLDLRINTVWGFKRKLTSRIAELKRNVSKTSASRWEEVVYLGPSADNLDVRSRVSGFLRHPLGKLRK